MIEVWFLVLASTLRWDVHLANAGDTFVTCLNCLDVASPSDCRDSSICGKGEICFTREFTDHRGRQGYRLGCEDQARCNLFLNAKTLVGKRDVAAATSDKCYDCCTGDECNGHLCQGGGSQVSTGIYTTNYPTVQQTTTGFPTCNCPKTICPPTNVVQCSVCPPDYIHNDNSCYMFSDWTTTWNNASAYCKSKGGDLVSINSEKEQDFIGKQLSRLCVRSGDIFTGGVYSPSLQKWEWVDGSPVQYEHWDSGYPGKLWPGHVYYITLTNPCYSSFYKTTPWWVTGNSSSLLFLCEKQAR